MKTPSRCSWCGDDPLYVAYHDQEWGVPRRGENALFESLILEGAQAGLAWITILRKREDYRKAFAGFDAAKMARFDAAMIEKLLQDPGIVRNRLKIKAAVSNARAYLDLVEEQGSLTDYAWAFVGDKPIVHRYRTLEQIPASTPLSDRISKDLKKRGFKFVGGTIVYAWMQANGLVNDHLLGCDWHPGKVA